MSEYKERANYLVRQWLWGDSYLWELCDNMTADMGAARAAASFADIIRARMAEMTVERLAESDYTNPFDSIVLDLWALAFKVNREPAVDIADYVGDLMANFSAILAGREPKPEVDFSLVYLSMASEDDVQADLMWAYSLVDFDDLLAEFED